VDNSGGDGVRGRRLMAVVAIGGRRLRMVAAAIGRQRWRRQCGQRRDRWTAAGAAADDGGRGQRGGWIYEMM